MTTAIILAGGLGTRLREAVPDLPKPMAPINGRPFMEFQMDYWIKQGVQKFIISVGYLYEIIMDHFGTSYQGIPIEYAIEKTPLGTGGGLILATKSLSEHEPFLLLNGDTFFEVDLETLLNFHKEKRSDWTFSLFGTNEVGRYMGMDVAEDGRILSLKSESVAVGQLANGGVYLLAPSVLKQFDSQADVKLSLEDDILPTIMNTNGVLYGVECRGRFIDIGIPDDYFRAAEVIPQ